MLSGCIPVALELGLHRNEAVDEDHTERIVLQRELSKRLIAAYDEVIGAVLDQLRDGGKPSRRARFPSFSLRDNGMPTLGDGSWSGEGPFEYTSLLDPPYGDEAARQQGKFPPDRFPAVAALTAFVKRHPAIARIRAGTAPDDDLFTRIGIELLLARAADQHFLRFGETAVTAAPRRTILRPLFKGLFDQRLGIAVLAPITLVGFEFDRFRLAPNAYVLRMSDKLQRARWEAKAYGVSGHDQVLASATHAFVLTGWSIENGPWLGVANALSDYHQVSRAPIDAFFAALRIATGVDTGYTQELRLSRGWRHRHNYGLPDIHGVGARQYPEHFDNFGWNRTDVPQLTRHQMEGVRTLYTALVTNKREQLELAVRRLNAAMIRADPADAILDATIALEILLGDREGQAINWKLRMRGAALVANVGGQSAGEAMHDAIRSVYDARSAIVHGGSRRGNLTDKETARLLAIDTLRRIIDLLIQHPVYLDPQQIDRELLRAPPMIRTCESAKSAP